MLRKLLGAVVAMVLPSLLAGQAPRTPNPAAAAKATVTHGIAMQVQGEVASPVEEMDGQNNQEGVDEADGQNDGGQLDQDDVDEPDDLNDDLDVGDQVDEVGEDEDDDDNAPPAPPSGAGQLSRIGRHKP